MDSPDAAKIPMSPPETVVRRVARRVDFPCKVGGFSSPPCPVRFQFWRANGRWTILGVTPPGWPPSLARWLESYRPAAIRIGPGLFPRVLQAEFEELPPEWARLLSSLAVHWLELSPAGTASLFVNDLPHKIQEFARSIGSSRRPVRISQADLGSAADVLTPGQVDDLYGEVALGPKVFPSIEADASRPFG